MSSKLEQVDFIWSRSIVDTQIALAYIKSHPLRLKKSNHNG